MNSSNQPVTIEVDMRGQICPSSLLSALEQVNAHRAALRAGEVVLLIKTDNRDATATIPGVVTNMGYGVQVVKCTGYYKILIGTAVADRSSDGS